MPGQTHPDYWARIAPDKPALVMVDGGGSISYRDLVARSNQAAHLFSSLGIARGDTIAILMENNVVYPELLWAAKNSGLRYVAASTHLNAADAHYVIDDCGARLFIASHHHREIALEAAERLDPSVRLLMIDGAEGRFEPYQSMRDRMPDTPLPDRRRGASMLYSSGTTGRPKGVRTELADLPPETPPQRFPMVLEQYGFDNATVFMDCGPFYHAAPQRLMMTVLRAGGTVLGAQRFDPLATLVAIDRYGATHAFFVPTMLRRLLALSDTEKARYSTATMRHAIHAAAPCPHDVKRAMIDWWGPVIDELYGGTESFGHCFITSTEWLAHPGSVGRPPANCRLKIVDADGGQLPPGVPGRIMMMNGMRFEYHGQAAVDAQPYDAEGYASLGDVGYLDADGYLYLTDRESHMIIAGGVNIYPQEAEQILAEHPAVEDVAVVGIPHEDMGEEVKALVVLHNPTDAPDRRAAELLAWCRKRLSSFKCPRSIQFVAALPRNDMGKLVKRMLEPQYLAAPGPYM